MANEKDLSHKLLGHFGSRLGQSPLIVVIALKYGVNRALGFSKV